MRLATGIIAIILCHFGNIEAQEISTSVVSNPDLTYCKPGVCNKSPGKGLLIDYRLQPDFNYNGENGTTTVDYNSHFTAKIKIPFVLKPGIKMLIGFNYQLERYAFSEDNQLQNFPVFNRLNEASLKTARTSLYISKPLNNRFYTTFKLDLIHAGDYDGFMGIENRYATYRGAGIFGIKKSEELEYGFGLLVSKSFRNLVALPFGFYNRTFNDKWGIELALPVSMKARYNINDKNLLLFGPSYRSRSYSIDVANGTPEDLTSIFHFRRHAIEVSATYMHNIGGWAWVQASTGYVNNLNTAVRDTELKQDFTFTPANGFYASVGFFLSPPSNKK